MKEKQEKQNSFFLSIFSFFFFSLTCFSLNKYLLCNRKLQGLEFRLFLSVDLPIRTVAGIYLLGERLILYISYFNDVCALEEEDTWYIGKTCKARRCLFNKKYSHCPMFMICKFRISNFHGLLASHRRSSSRHLAHFENNESIGPLHKNDNGRFIDDIYSKGDRLTSEHKLGVVFYINCTPFTTNILMCVPIGPVLYYFRNLVINRLSKGLCKMEDISKTHIDLVGRVQRKE